MNMVRVAGWSTSNLYGIVVNSDHEYGMPEGLCHWDGSEWRWVARNENVWTLDCDTVNETLLMLDYNGVVRRYTPHGWVAPLSLHHVGCNALCPTPNGEFFVAGNDGLLLEWTDGVVKELASGTRESLYRMCATNAGILACGTTGTIVFYDGKSCRLLRTGYGGNLTDITVGPSGHAYAVGADADGAGSILIVSPDMIVTRQELPVAFQDVVVVTEGITYGATLEGSLFHWDGRDVHQVAELDGLLIVSYLTVIRGQLLACGFGGVVILDGGRWVRIPLSMDPSYLA